MGYGLGFQRHARSWSCGVLSLALIGVAGCLPAGSGDGGGAGSMDAGQSAPDAADMGRSDDRGASVDRGAVDMAAQVIDAAPPDAGVIDARPAPDARPTPPDASGVDAQQTPPDAAAVDARPGPPGTVATASETVLFTTDEGTNELLRIDLDPLAVEVQTGLQFRSNTISMAFDTRGALYRTGGTTLVRLDPCTGEVALVGPFGGDWYVPGLAVSATNELFGISNNPGDLVRIDPRTGAAERVGPLGRRFGNTGLSWDNQGQRLLAIDAADDGLYAIDPQTGAAALLVRIQHDFDSVGIEVDPLTGVLYACTARQLLAVDATTGAVQILGPITNGPCNDLAVSWHDVVCADE